MLHAKGMVFFLPTVVTGVSCDINVAYEETFGSLAQLCRLSTYEEVVEMANATEFGLAAYFYSRDIGRIWRVAEALEYGMVGINTGRLCNAAARFGGAKQSGLGGEGAYAGLDAYSVSTCVGLGLP